MKKLDLDTAENLSRQMRSDLGLGDNEPISMKTVIRQLNIMAIYRPLSEKLFGLSLKSNEGNDRFMLINSNSTRGRQHFTIAHELFHLFYDENPKPHFFEKDNATDSSERSANMFASALLMPRDGIIQKLSAHEIAEKEISIGTAIRVGQLYGVSHSTLVVRLKELKLISKRNVDSLMAISIRHEASMRGYDISLYESGNHGLVIGDFGSLARKLYDDEKISEGHYMELLNIIGYGEGEDSVGC